MSGPLHSLFSGSAPHRPERCVAEVMVSLPLLALCGASVLAVEDSQRAAVCYGGHC